jgi:glycosyltransferase involved in cell wall biosynthesis
MRLLHLTPGTGTFHCGSCLRDNALVKALRARGHDAAIAPLYLPMVTDADEGVAGQPVRVGGIALYLQEKFPLFRFAPQWLRDILNDEHHLRSASLRLGMTSPRDLGLMTVGSLQGEEGRQWPEWERLVQWIVDDIKPEALSLSNSLLMGLAPALRKRVGVPIICSLQGEDAFLDTLVEPFRSQAWELMKENARSVSRFIAPSRFYADVMAPRLGVISETISVIHNGIDSDAYARERTVPDAPVIGYLARMIHGKGLTMLVDAFIELARRGTVPEVQLRIAGAQTPEDEAYVRSLTAKLREAGLSKRVTFEPNLTFDEKVKFLNELSLFSVPATYGEAFGLYVIEAQACGVPVVQPRHGAFPEILAATQGGILCEPDSVDSLASAWENLLLNTKQLQQLSDVGKYHTRAHFSAARMAERFESLMNELKK